MKWFLYCYCALAFSLLGCQHLPSFSIDKEPQSPPLSMPEVNELEQAVRYGANFAYQHSKAADDTCVKYKKLYEQGDWRAGWVLALHVNESNAQSCLNNKEAILILTALESEKKINPELIWVNQYHLRLLQKLQKKTKAMNRLQRSVRHRKKQVADLEVQNKEQSEELEALKAKLEALKAIETSIMK